MIEWQGKHRCRLGELEFRLLHWSEGEATAEGDEFLLFKNRQMVERYAQLIRALQPRHIMELGIHSGGSTALIHALSGAVRTVAIELESEPVAALEAYIEAAGGSESLATFYGVDQADIAAVLAIVEREFGGEPLDLVIDDASHFLEETRTSFETLFPHLRPGGVYVIEDWAWAQSMIRSSNIDKLPAYKDKRPLSELVLQLVEACPSTPDMIRKIEINRFCAFIWRGADELDREGGFRLG